MELLTLPLAFGNVTLAATILVIALLVLTLIVELGIFIIKKTLALDTEDAPDVKLKNPLRSVGLPTAFYYVVNKKWKLLSSDRTGWFHESTFHGIWYFKKEALNKVSTVEKASGIIKAGWVSSFITIGVVTIVLDLLILLLQISFLPTLCITLTFTTMFCIRTLAKRFYKGMKNHKDRLDGHDKDIEELKENK